MVSVARSNRITCCSAPGAAGELLSAAPFDDALPLPVLPAPSLRIPLPTLWAPALLPTLALPWDSPQTHLSPPSSQSHQGLPQHFCAGVKKIPPNQALLPRSRSSCPLTGSEDPSPHQCLLISPSACRIKLTCLKGPASPSSTPQGPDLISYHF